VILIAFRHSDTRLFARVVTLLRGGDSAHCEVAIHVQGVRLCVSASWLDGGVRGKVIDISNPDKWRVYRWTGQHIDPIDWLKVNHNARYDRRGLLGILLPTVGHNPTKKFCSEAAAEMLMLPHPETYDLVQLERFVMASEHAERLQ
jgi:hypothetical protein